MKHISIFLLLSCTLPLYSMEQTERSIAPFTVDILPLIAQSLDLRSISRLLRTCSTYSNPYRKISKETVIQSLEHHEQVTEEDLNTIQFGMNRFLQQNPVICKSLSPDDHLTTLVHYARTNNNTMFSHIVTLENSDNRALRVTALEFFEYLDKDRTTTWLKDVYNGRKNMSAYRAICKNNNSMNHYLIHLAIKEKVLYLVKLFVKNEVNLNTKSASTGHPTLHTAIITQNEKIVRLLINKGASPVGCLERAAKRGFTRMVEILLNKYGITEDSYYILHTAAEHGHAETVKLLLERGFRINFPNSRDETPLHLAARNGHFHVVKMLVEHGADITMKNKGGDTAWWIADTHYRANNKQCYYEIRKYLAEKASSIETDPCTVS